MKSKDYPRIVTNGYCYRIELSEGEFYRETSGGIVGILGPLIVEWRTFYFCRRKLKSLLKKSLIGAAQWRPVLFVERSTT